LISHLVHLLLLLGFNSFADLFHDVPVGILPSRSHLSSHVDHFLEHIRL
jgi:hypothetical protein